MIHTVGITGFKLEVGPNALVSHMLAVQLQIRDAIGEVIRNVKMVDFSHSDFNRVNYALNRLIIIERILCVVGIGLPAVCVSKIGG